MLKLKNKKLNTYEDSSSFYEYEVWQNGKVNNNLHAQLFHEDKPKSISLEFKQNFDSSKFIDELHSTKFKSFIKVEESNADFLGYSLFILEFYYNWQELYFPLQSMYVVKQLDKYCLKFLFILPDDNIIGWNYKFHPKFVIEELTQIVAENKRMELRYTPEEDFSNKFEISFYQDENSIIGESIKSFIEELQKIEFTLYDNIEGFRWKQEYFKDEKKFSLEVLLPLLKKMKFQSVRYIHGTEEYGRDFLFHEINKFGKKVNFGLQAKAGDISGGANSLIDTLINQVDDAFKMPFNSLGEKEEEYISFFIIATSGKYKKNAKMKLVNKLPERYKQYVLFWGYEEIMDLIDDYWKEN